MNAYEEALSQALDELLAMKNCEVVDVVLRQSMLELLRDSEYPKKKSKIAIPINHRLLKEIREIAVRTTNLSNHAGRTAPSYFDLERVFGLMKINAGDLKATAQRHLETGEVVECPAPQTLDQDFHKGPQPMLTASRPREMGCITHIPDYFPPFPGAHTYKNTVMEQVTDRGYITVRNRHADNELNIQKALNKFYLKSSPKITLIESGSGDVSGQVLAPGPPKKPSFLDALMPRNQVFDTDIYENKEEITHGALICPFLMDPKERRSDQSPGHFVGDDVEMQELHCNVELDSASDDDMVPVADGGMEVAAEVGAVGGAVGISMPEINWSQPD
ncbi:transcription initiation factor TFIID subunit 8 [Drosophila eugracilis]|uniref:transcription initiation factor TFIID subunit 8 n=1 Tax=Drosophila eugracilis TaxID=29029 RepID=UPI001BD9933A|nr:transcription initiation factor TFIID subunit 8 [Drosophila eugracilis]